MAGEESDSDSQLKTESAPNKEEKHIIGGTESVSMPPGSSSHGIYRGIYET